MGAGWRCLTFIPGKGKREPRSCACLHKRHSHSSKAAAFFRILWTWRLRGLTYISLSIHIDWLFITRCLKTARNEKHILHNESFIVIVFNHSDQKIIAMCFVTADISTFLKWKLENTSCFDGQVESTHKLQRIMYYSVWIPMKKILVGFSKSMAKSVEKQHKCINHSQRCLLYLITVYWK